MVEADEQLLAEKQVGALYYPVERLRSIMSEESDDAIGAEVLSLLGDEYARSILTETSLDALSVPELSERCDASRPTIYRRIERLNDYELLREQQMIDPEGHHYKLYDVNFEQLIVSLKEGELSIELDLREEDPVDRFTRLYEELQ